MRRFAGIAAALFLLIITAGCGIGKRINTSDLFAMNTVMELQVRGDEALLTRAEEMIRTLEKKLSVTDESSEIYLLNQSGNADLSGDVSDILRRALEVCDESGGALDITIYPVLRAWGFTTGSYRVPEDSEIELLLSNVGYGSVQLTDDGHARVLKGTAIDLGSVAKGYTGSAVADYFRSEGVTSALINLGGNVECVGTKPNGEKWKIAIKSPFEDSSSGVIGVLEAEDEAIITSGGYERFFEKDGEVYWHILDPRTGKPAKSGLSSVTVIGKDGLRCDGLSTALFVMGLDDAIEFWKTAGDFEAVLITDDGKVYVTEGAAADFSLTPEYRDAVLSIVNR